MKNITFTEACQILKNWIEESQGELITLTSGEECCFRRIKQHTMQEITKFEEENNICLPDSYKYFLTTVGANESFINEYGLGFEFHPLDDSFDYSSKVFSGMVNPFPRLVLTVSLTGRGDEGGFDLSRHQNDNFSVFSHEEDPEEWLNETTDWCDFKTWLIKFVESEGEDDLP